MVGEAWWATVHGVAKSRIQLTDFMRVALSFCLRELVPCWLPVRRELAFGQMLTFTSHAPT